MPKNTVCDMMITTGVKLHDIGFISREMMEKLFISAHNCYTKEYEEKQKNISNSK